MAYTLIPAGIIPTEPLNEQYAVTLPNPYLRGDYEQGLPRQVRKFRNAPTKFAVTWPLNPAQYEILLGWLEDAAGGLGGWFDVPVFRGECYERMSVRFVMPLPDPKRQGGEWMFSGVLETMSYKVRDAWATLAAMIAYGGGDGFETFTDRVHTAVHVTYPAACP